MVGVHLEGVRHLYLDGVTEWAFHPRRFRPVTKRPTDITIFRKIAESAAVDQTKIRPVTLQRRTLYQQ